jgi:hypothetical protein
MSNYIEHAKREFKAIGYIPLDQEQEDGPNKWIQENLIELLEVFSKQGHSGFSAGYCINAFNKLARFEPLAPLTGEDWEWQEVSESLWQNIRCGRVFKDETGQAYDVEGKVFVEPDGCAFTSGGSKVGVTFPYTPKTEYVNVEERQED